MSEKTTRAESVPIDAPRPTIYDGFGFFKDALDGIVKFYFFDDVIKVHGPEPVDPAAATDREVMHVILTSVRKAKVHIEEPFTSNFIDPFVYATHMAHAGFSGLMIRNTRHSLMIVRDSIKHLMFLHAQTNGFFYPENGVEVFYEGKSK